MPDPIDLHGGVDQTGTPPLIGAPFEYPAKLECDVITRSGVPLHLRPIRPDDAQRLVSFHQRLTPDSIYHRYFFVHPILSDVEVEHLTRVDYIGRLALIIEDQDLLVAVGRYDRYPGTSEAEVAFVVADQYQHHGIGLLLLEHLADAAWLLGITTLIAETQAENRDMLNVFIDSGFPVTSTLEDEILSVRFPIEPTIASRAHRAQRISRTSNNPGREN